MRENLFHHFFPSHKHKKRAKLLRHDALFYYFIIFSLFVVLLKVVKVNPSGILGYASNINSQDLLKYTNEERAKHGLPELVINDKLSQAANLKAQDMFKNNYWAHVSPAGVEPWYFFEKEDYDYSYAGENLAKNFNDSKGVVRAWMNSPSHRENILNSNYNEMGFAVVNGDLQGYQTTLVVQFFGRQRNSAISAKPASGIESGQNVKVLSLNPVVADATKDQPVLNSPSVIDVTTFTRSVIVLFGSFMVLLFVIDYMYTKATNIVKINGNTLAHLVFFAFVLISLGITLVPGNIG